MALETLRPTGRRLNWARLTCGLHRGLTPSGATADMYCDAVDGACVRAHIGRMRQYRQAVRGGQSRRRRATSRGILMLSMSSSSIAAAGYDAEGQVLRVRFVGGATYDYFGVPNHVFKALLDAPSKGRFVNWQVKPCYRFMRLERQA